MTQRYTAAQFIKAAVGSGGIYTEIADRVGCDRRTVASYAKKYPTVAKAIQTARESVLDLAEARLVQAVNKGDPWAIKFLLATLGKRRGFTEKREIEQSGKVDVEVTFADEWREQKAYN